MMTMQITVDGANLAAMVGSVCGVLIVFLQVLNNILTIRTRREVIAAQQLSIDNGAKLDAAVPTIEAVHAQVQTVVEQTNGMIGKIEQAAEARGAAQALEQLPASPSRARK